MDYSVIIDLSLKNKGDLILPKQYQEKIKKALLFTGLPKKVRIEKILKTLEDFFLDKSSPIREEYLEAKGDMTDFNIAIKISKISDISKDLKKELEKKGFNVILV